MEKQAKIMSKGRITGPRAVRQALGVQPTESPFSKYRGIGNPGIRSGRGALGVFADIPQSLFDQSVVAKCGPFAEFLTLHSITAGAHRHIIAAPYVVKTFPGRGAEPFNSGFVLLFSLLQ